MTPAPVAQRALHYIKAYYIFVAGFVTGLVCGIIIENAIFYWLIYGYLPFGIGH